MPQKQIIKPAKGAPAVGPYNHGVRIGDLLAIKSRIVDGQGPDVPAGALAVEFDRVTFGYNQEESVLSEVSFCLEPGEVARNARNYRLLAGRGM